MRKSITLRVRTSGSVSSEIIREIRENHAEADKNLFEVIVCDLKLYCFQKLNISSTTIEYIYHSAYAKLSSHQLTVRDSGSKHAMNCVYLTSLKIAPTI